MRLTIKKKELLYGGVFVPFFVPLGLMNFQVIKIIWYGYLACVMFFVFIQIIKSKGIKDLKNVWSLALSLGLYVLAQYYTTLQYGVNSLFTLYKAIYLVVLCIFFQYALNKNPYLTLKIIDIILLISICISIFCKLLGVYNPNGEFVSVYVSLPAWITVRVVRNMIINRGKSDFMPLIVSGFAVLATIVHSEKGIYGDASYEWTFFVELIVVCGAYYFRSLISILKRVLNTSVLFGTILALNLLFVIFQSFSQIEIIHFILVDVMHKDITFTGRTDIWNFAISIIKKKPVWGYGEGLIGYRANSYWENFIKVHGAHNQFLEIALFGGYVSLFFYILVFGIIWFKTHKEHNMIGQFIIIGLFSILLELSFVYRPILMCTPLYFLMVLAINSNLFTSDRIKKVSI